MYKWEFSGWNSDCLSLYTSDSGINIGHSGTKHLTDLYKKGQNSPCI